MAMSCKNRLAMACAEFSAVMVEADVRDGRAIIRIGIEHVTRKIVRDLPCGIEGFPVVAEEQSGRALY